MSKKREPTAEDRARALVHDLGNELAYRVNLQRAIMAMPDEERAALRNLVINARSARTAAQELHEAEERLETTAPQEDATTWPPVRSAHLEATRLPGR